MSKKMVKIISVLMMVMMIITTLSQSVLAAAKTDKSANKVDQSTAGSVTQFDIYGDDSGASASAQKIIGALITLVRIVGTGVAIIMLIVLAIKYISAAPSDKAEIKKHAVVYVVGAVVLFAASGILGIIQQFASNVSAS